MPLDYRRRRPVCQYVPQIHSPQVQSLALLRKHVPKRAYDSRAVRLRRSVGLQVKRAVVLSRNRVLGEISYLSVQL